MRFILDMLERIFKALSGIYTKAESDAQLAVKADKAEVEAEAKARQEANDTAAQERESARLREQWKSQCYAEFRFENTSTTKTQYDLFKVTANGAWWIDYGDGNCAQLQTELVSTPVLDFGSDIERFVRIYGAITELDFDVRSAQDSIVLKDTIVDSQLLLSFKAYGLYVCDSKSTLVITAPLCYFSTGKGRVTWNVGQVYCSVNKIFLNANSTSTTIFESTGAFTLANDVGSKHDSVAFFTGSTSLSIGISNFRAYNSIILDAPNVISTNADFRFMSAIESSVVVRIRLASLSSAPNFFSGYSANRFTLKQMLPTLESLPVWADGKTHNFGIHCRYTETTETFTATDADGTEYSLENCPLFDEDDAEQTFRKAYVLTIAKKGWTILLKNKNA